MKRGGMLGGLFALLGFALGACGPLGAVSDDCESCAYYSTSDGHLMSWPGGSHVNFVFHAQFPRELRERVSAAAERYNSAITAITLHVKMNGDGAPGNGQSGQGVSGDRVNGIYWVTGEWPWENSNPGADAITLVAFNSKNIAEADIFFRAESFPLGEDSTDELLQVLAAHEIGHAIGRVHSTENDSIMNPFVGLDLLRRPFSEFDFEQLGKIYGRRPEQNASMSFALENGEAARSSRTVGCGGH